MILTLINWCYISLLAFIVGIGFATFLKHIRGSIAWEWDMLLMSGVMLLTVYAQFYSLFGGVGRNANLLLCVSCVFIVVICRKEITLSFSNLKSRIKINRKSIFWCIALMAIIVMFAIISCQKAGHADTDGYHAQAIHWIEEYGVVKGLGNLYNRLAYNSAFMSLQALFSWKFLINQSMHVMNGYLCCIMAIYAITNIWDKGTQYLLSNFLRILLLLYISVPQSISVMSSPNTDTMALLLVLYILSKWCDYLESGNNSIDNYAVLCVLSVFAISVKLSTGLLIVLALKPAIQYIKSKDGKAIMLFVSMGILVLLPYLMRNVIISGYMVYPYSFIDVFNVDWKMPQYMVDYDRREIMAWGRALRDVNKSHYTFSQWFPIWWSDQTLWLQILFVINIILLPIGIAYTLRDLIKKNYNYALVTAAAILLFAGWFLTAPLQRYGIVFVFLIPGILLGYVCKQFSVQKIWGYLKISFSIVFICLLAWEMRDMDEISLKRPAYYIARECRTVEWSGIQVYLPVENGYMGYYYLPATQHEGILNYIELRANELSDGFKIKDECRGLKINTYGNVD